MCKMCNLAVGVVGGSEGNRHVANVIVGGWDEERRSWLRQARGLSPLSLNWRCAAATGEVGAVGSYWFLVLGHWFIEKYGIDGGNGCQLSVISEIRGRVCGDCGDCDCENGFARKGW